MPLKRSRKREIRGVEEMEGSAAEKQLLGAGGSARQHGRGDAVEVAAWRSGRRLLGQSKKTRRGRVDLGRGDVLI